jgi:hypothetical protein
MSNDVQPIVPDEGLGLIGLFTAVTDIDGAKTGGIMGPSTDD